MESVEAPESIANLSNLSLLYPIFLIYKMTSLNEMKWSLIVIQP